MTATAATVRILVIRSWTAPITALRRVLQSAGYATQIVRVDLEPALHAALAQETFDAIIFDEHTVDLTLATVERAVHENACGTPLVVLSSVETLAAQLADALRARLN